MRIRTPYEIWGKETPKGWDHIVDPLIEKLQKNNIPIAQIKEKFAQLRVCLDEQDEEIDEWVRQAEEQCVRTCMDCGKEGELRGGSWLRVLCDVHHKERENVRNK